MKLTNFNTDEVITSENFDSGDFGITASGLIVVASILRDKLYNDKIMAPIREYCSNAWDAHVMVGKKNIPISITVPSQFNPVFKVRDFGPGLSESEVADLYTKYGESTKRNTNRAIGSFGIGCKSGFCVSDSFLVISFYNGVRNTYNCYLDEKGVGKYALMSSDVTTEENGIEIQIPVDPKKIYEWISKIKSFCTYCTPKPVIVGIDPSQVLTPEITDFWFKESTWQLNKNNTYGSKVIMGIVAYDISYEKLGIINEKYKTLLNNFSVIISAGIGTVDPAANRESLEYTEKTINYITRKLDEIVLKIKEKCEEKIKNVKSLWEAKLLYTELYDNQLSYAEKQLFSAVFGYNSFEWNGQKISSNIFRFDNYGDGITITKYIKSDWGRRYIDYTPYSEIRANKDVLIINQDADFTSSNDLYSRIGDLVYNQNKVVYVIDLRKSKHSVDDLTKKYSLDQMPIQQFSSLPIKKDWRPKGANSNITPRSPAVSARTLQLKTNLTTAPYNVSEYWEPSTIDLANGTGYYVPLDRFLYEIDGITYNGNKLLYLRKAAIEHLKLDNNIPIYGFKKSIIESGKIGPGWTNFITYIVDAFVDKFKKENIIDIINKHNVVNDQKDYNVHNEYIKLLMLKSILSTNHPIMKFIKELEEVNTNYQALKIKEIISALDTHQLYKRVVDKINQTLPAFNLRNDFISYIKKTYPMISYAVANRYVSDIGYTTLTHCRNYIDLIDNQPKPIDNQQTTV
jgi:hypothetical protein